MTDGGRRPLVVGNWKMHLGEAAAGDLLDRLRADGLGAARAEVGVAPTFPLLRMAVDRLGGSGIRVGVQNHHFEDQGAFTGEVSPRTVAEIGASFAILGHSERRHGLGESDDVVARKVAAARRHGLTPVVCVGETETERLEGRTRDVVGRQILAVAPAAGPGTVLAYEPVWAIGTGRTATLAQIAEMHAAIRRFLSETLGTDAAKATRILYGGSVNAGNAEPILRLDDVDGALVGGASLDPAAFGTIVRGA